MVASSSAGFLSSIRPRGRPLTKSTTSGRRVCLALGDGELVDGQPVVVGRVFEVDDADLIPAHCALGIAVLDLDSVDEHAVEGAIAGFDGRALRAYQLAECVVERFDRQAGVQSGQGVPEPKIQHHLSVVAALCNGRVGGDVRSLSNLPAQVGKP